MAAKLENAIAGIMVATAIPAAPLVAATVARPPVGDGPWRVYARGVLAKDERLVRDTPTARDRFDKKAKCRRTLAMVAYVVATMSIHDPETYKKYTALTPATVKKHGGRFLTRGEEVFTAEGERFTERMVILEFPSADAAKAWHADPEYDAASKFRRAASKGRMIIQEGGTNTADPDPKI